MNALAALTVISVTFTAPDSATDHGGPIADLDSCEVRAFDSACCTRKPWVIARFDMKGLEGHHVRLTFDDDGVGRTLVLDLRLRRRRSPFGDWSNQAVPRMGAR